MATKFLNLSTDTTLGGVFPSDEIAVSQKAIKTKIDTKQDTLVSGTNIKTVNGNSLLGSGDITISGGVAWGNITGNIASQADLQTALNNKVDLDLGNISSAGAKVLDGQWVLSSLSLLSVATIGTTHTSHSLSSYLPNDGYSYEVIVQVGTANGNAVVCESDLGYAVVSRGASSGPAQLYNTGIIVVGTGRTAETYTYSGTSSNTEVKLLAYRRIGTNS